MKGFIYSPQDTLFGQRAVIGFGSDEFRVEEIDRKLANNTIIANHYSGKIYNGSILHLGVYLGKRFVGVLQYGRAMNPASGGSIIKGALIDDFLELNRMWLSDEAPRNSESKAISYSIKYIKQKRSSVKWIQSFADERCGRFGVVYQAANFKYYGEHISTFWELDGVIYHNTLMTAKLGKQGKAGDYLQANKEKATSSEYRQFRYIYFIDKREINKCLLDVKPYPKHGEEL